MSPGRDVRPSRLSRTHRSSVDVDASKRYEGPRQWGQCRGWGDGDLVGRGGVDRKVVPKDLRHRASRRCAKSPVESGPSHGSRSDAPEGWVGSVTQDTDLAGRGDVDRIRGGTQAPDLGETRRDQPATRSVPGVDGWRGRPQKPVMPDSARLRSHRRQAARFRAVDMNETERPRPGGRERARSVAARASVRQRRTDSAGRGGVRLLTAQTVLRLRLILG